MREILFRGQTRRKGEKVRMDGTPVESNWVYGGIFPNNDGGDFAIIYQQEPEIEKLPVYSDTVCQYIGMTDKNRNKIFEKDIVKYSGETFYINYNERFAAFECKHYNNMRTAPSITPITCERMEIIGNVFDNPELMELNV